MPPVRISWRRGKPTGFAPQVGDIGRHSAGAGPEPVSADHGARPERPGVGPQRASYRALAERCHSELDVRRDDQLVRLVEVKRESGSFGLGVAQ